MTANIQRSSRNESLHHEGLSELLQPIPLSYEADVPDQEKNQWMMNKFLHRKHAVPLVNEVLQTAAVQQCMMRR